MYIYAMTKTKEDCYELKKLMTAHNKMDIYWGAHAHWQAHIDTTANKYAQTIGWWTGDEEPVFPDHWLISAYWQGDKPLSEFWEHIKNEELLLEQSKQVIFFTKIKPIFKYLNFVIETRPCWHVRIDEGGGANSPLGSLMPKAIENTLYALKVANVKAKRLKKLYDRYPYLVMTSGSMKDLPEWIEMFNHYSNEQWHVWIRRADDYSDGTRFGGTATRFSFEYPPTKETIATLDKLNHEGGKSQPKDMFFCTQCLKALPRTQYAMFLFAESRCLQCATPEWIARAKSETYN